MTEQSISKYKVVNSENEPCMCVLPWDFTTYSILTTILQYFCRTATHFVGLAKSAHTRVNTVYQSFTNKNDFKTLTLINVYGVWKIKQIEALFLKLSSNLWFIRWPIFYWHIPCIMLDLNFLSGKWYFNEQIRDTVHLSTSTRFSVDALPTKKFLRNASIRPNSNPLHTTLTYKPQLLLLFQ